MSEARISSRNGSIPAHPRAGLPSILRPGLFSPRILPAPSNALRMIPPKGWLPLNQGNLSSLTSVSSRSMWGYASGHRTRAGTPIREAGSGVRASTMTPANERRLRCPNQQAHHRWSRPDGPPTGLYCDVRSIVIGRLLLEDFWTSMAPRVLHNIMLTERNCKELEQRQRLC